MFCYVFCVNGHVITNVSQIQVIYIFTASSLALKFLFFRYSFRHCYYSTFQRLIITNASRMRPHLSLNPVLCVFRLSTHSRCPKTPATASWEDKNNFTLLPFRTELVRVAFLYTYNIICTNYVLGV